MDEEQRHYDRAVRAISEPRIDVEYLLSIIATRPEIIHSRFHLSRSLLDVAASQLRLDVIKELIRLGANIDQRNMPQQERGHSALRRLVHSFNSAKEDVYCDILELLMNAGANPNLVDGDGLSAMFIVAKRRKERDEIMTFKHYGFEPDLNSLMYLVPFERYQQTMSVKSDDLAPFCLAVNGLLTCAVNIANRDPEKSLKLVEFLLELGLVPNADATPFQQPLAEYLQNTPVAPKIAAMLLAKGADPSVKNSDGVQILRICDTYIKQRKRRGEDACHFEEFAELLMQYGGKRYG